jgi:hypothetical protein
MNVTLTSAMGKRIHATGTLAMFPITMTCPHKCFVSTRHVARNFEQHGHGKEEKLLPCAKWFDP